MTELTLAVENIGGIDEYECTFDSRVGIVSGPNASNKTSLLQALAFGLGRSTVPIKNDAEEARVELEIDGDRVVRTASATPNGTTVSGEGWLTDSADVELLDQFACLLEFNDLRQAVRSDSDFEQLLKSPMNLDALERERADKLEQKRSLQADVDQLDSVDTKLETTRSELSDTRERVNDLEAELDDLRAEQTEVSTEDDEQQQLRERRADLVSERNEYERQIADLEDAIDRLDDRADDIDAEIEAAREEAQSYDIEQLEARREETEQQLRDIEDRIDIFQSVLTANREMLNSPHRGALGQDRGLVEDTLTCWACGNEAAESDVEATAERLQELVAADKERRREYEPQLSDIDAEIEAATEAQRRVERLEGEKRDIEQQRESRVESLETQRERLEEIRAELSDLDEQLEAYAEEQESEVSGLAAEIEQVQMDLHTARSEVDRLESRIDDLEDKREQRAAKSARIEELSAEIADLTEQIENREQRLRTKFNEAMDDILSVLGYDAVDRVWLDGNFDLVIAREIDGVTRQDAIEHLSESERETVGLVLGLAGYVAYDVADSVPVLLMDTLGAFDADRVAELIAYFADEAPHLVTALLPANADAVAAHDIDHDLVKPDERLVSP
ncbi:archaea-specific SMC-related protein [Halovenus marina]|uniref:archaea-specific SMC-related protein n=1 Tax=Halovenus marina TaxID=3396621 RepID=UPI003F547D3A